MPTQIVGMPWYRAEHFSRLRAMFEDGHKLHRTHEQWLVAAEASHKALQAKGVRVVCVDIDPDQFPEWCKANGMNLNAEAGNRYASLIAYKVATGAQDGGGTH